MSPVKDDGKDEGKIIAVASGKGGTGKTVSTLNIGMALHKLGKDVLIVDGDLQDPNIGVNLGIYSPQVTINEAVERKQNILEALYIHDSGLRVIPASLSINYLHSNIKSIGSLIKDIDGYVLIDCGPGLDENILSTFGAADSIIAVTNPMRTSISGTIRLLEIANDLDKDVEGIIVNNLTSKEVTKEEIEHITGFPVIGEIPYDPKVDEAIVNRRPLVDHSPHSPAALEFQKVAHMISGHEYTESLGDSVKRFYTSVRSFLSFR